MVTTMQNSGVISDLFNGPAVAWPLAQGLLPGDSQPPCRPIQEAMACKGFSLIDIMQPCVSFNKINTTAWYKKRVRVYELERPAPDTLDNAMPLGYGVGRQDSHRYFASTPNR